ncbi:MAG: adenylate/guanylate cyclase domain-containing protein [Rhodospirillaceae bacterium]
MELELAILFVDVCDSTRLYESFGNVKAAEVIGALLGRLEKEVAGAGGRVVKSLGDGLMCVFSEPEAACRAATRMMAVAGGAKVAGQGSVRLDLRAGIHFGSVVSSGGDVFGDAINVASRVEAMASPSESLITEAAVNRLSEPMRSRCLPIETTRVRGKSAAIRVFALHKQSAEDSLTERTVRGGSLSADAIRAANFTLRLVYRGRERLVNLGSPKLTIGRHEGCDIVIQSRLASRQHGAVEFSRDSFVLTDHSSNGTYIRIGENPPIPLCREAAKLVGRGLLGIGAVPERPEQDHVIGFISDVDI